ncbi:MAG: YfbU family protein [Bacteroidales bacterium]|nr:YfbU family protein [Bacteroidales bacterium]
MNCINCGIEIPKNSNYCPQCGGIQNNKLKESDSKDKILDFLFHKILKIKLGDDFSKYFDNHVDYLENEFSNQFSGLLNLIKGDENAVKECKEVLEILEMYNSIISSYETLTDKQELDEQKILFPGFDATNENNYYDYACFFLDTLNMYERVQKHRKTTDLQTHSSTLEIYREMLKKWNEFKEIGLNIYNLTIQQITDLVKIHP